MSHTGQRILATRLDDPYWYPGSVHRQDGERCMVLFDDGQEHWLPGDQMVPLEIAAGDRVFVRLPGAGDYAVCRVLRRDGENLNVQFDDGSDERTSIGMVRIDPTQFKDPGGSQPQGRWIIGDRVLAKWSQDVYWYPATVQATEGSQFHVYFDDGDHEWMPAERVTDIDLQAGSRVFCRQQRGPGYVPGSIVRRDGDRIDVRYDNDQQENTTISFVRVTRGPVKNPWKAGQRVLAQWLYDPFFYPGVVKAVEGDVVHVQFDDGDQGHVPQQVVLPLKFAVGALVYCRRQSGPAYFPATIERQSGDQLYLRFDDGTVEWSPIRCVRVLPTDFGQG